MYYFNQYFANIQQALNEQNKKMYEYENKIKKLEQEIESLKDSSSTKIEKIEYKFDQLKIERLEGTLNIGLNPTDPNQIDNFDVVQDGVAINGVQRELKDQLRIQISEDLHRFLNEDCTRLIQQIETQYNYRLDEPHRRHIIEDIRKQIDSRIAYYVNGIQLSETDSFDEHKQAITANVKKDVENSITHFLNHLPNEMKGGQ